MRLLLDEHISPEIARQLRAKGHDVLAENLRLGRPTYGLICVPRRFSLQRDGIGRLVAALDALLTEHPADDAIIEQGGEVWLT